MWARMAYSSDFATNSGLTSRARHHGKSTEDDHDTRSLRRSSEPSATQGGYAAQGRARRAGGSRPTGRCHEPERRSVASGGESVTEHNVVPNLVRLFSAAKKADIVVAVSPHYYYGWDHHWKVHGPLEVFQHRVGAFDRSGPYTVEGFRGSGADFMPEFKPYIEDGKTIICSPHKLYGPQANDLTLQLRKQRVDQVVLAGMLANMCVESHLRDLLESGFEVAVVRDAVAAPKVPEGDGYLAAIINFRYMANGLWTTEQTVRFMHQRD
jgi:nicotinamidase-related amidase